MTLPEVSIIIVTYHNEATIDACIDSIRMQTSLSCEVIVVDNSEDLLTYERLVLLRHQCPSLIAIVRPERNLGFAAGCNLGARAAHARHLMFLNPDTVLQNDVAELLVSFMESHPRAALVGPVVLASDGAITRTCRNLPTVSRVLMDATGLDEWLGGYKLTRFSHTTSKMVDQIIGACFFTSREIFDAFHGFDERFFIYFEEVDFCKRVLDSGYQVWFYPAAKVVHSRGASTESIRQLANMIVALRRSRTLYFKKHFSKLHQLLMGLLNRTEGAAKGFIFTVLWLSTRRALYREKARGFLRVAICQES